MKKLIIPIMIFCSAFVMAQEGSEGKIQGDFDGNGTKEYAYIKVADCNDDCNGSCDTTVYFSDKKIKPFMTSLANGGSLYNLGDLNNDGKDDIGFYPYWCTSCWHSFYTYTLSKSGWKPLVDPISTHCSQWEEDKFPIKKDPQKKGNVIVTTSEWKDDDIKISSKSIKIN